MKTFFVAALFVTIVVAVVTGEQCTNNQACTQHAITHCSHHTHVVCETQSGQCECTGGQNGNTCTAQGDCAGTCTHGNNNNHHCVDGHCHCAHQ